MKRFIQLIVLNSIVLFSISSYGQRFLPLIEDGRSLTEGVHGPIDMVKTAIVYNDQLLFGGLFEDVNGDTEMNRLAYWNGTDYGAFEVPLDAGGSAAILDLLDTPLGLVASGRYNDAQNIIVFDGSNWQTPGEGLDDTVYDIIWFEDELYAAGRFSNSGGTAVNGIAKFDGSGWVAVDGGMDEDVFDLEVYGGQLYAVGEFTSAGSEICNRIARLNNGQWEAVGPGLDGAAYCMYIQDGELLIGGGFVATNDLSLNLYGLVSYDGINYNQIYSGSEELNIASILEFNDDILVSERGGGFNLFMTNAETWILNNDMSVEALPESIPEIHGVINYNNDLIIYKNEGQSALANESFYLNNCVFKYAETGSIQAFIHTEDIEALVRPSATLFNDTENSSAAYFVGDNDPQVATIYAAAPWMVAQTEDETQYFNYQEYGIDDLSPQFYFGPFSNNYNSDYLEKYLRVWKLSLQEVQSHISDYLTPGYQIPEAILNWPGNGRYTEGESTHLAPFEDLDGDGIYDPMDGEYPVIRGDECVYYILSTDRDDQYPDDIGLELGVMLYTYTDVPGTVFANYDMRNLSGNDYTDFKFGMWADGDIGTSIDDYVGSSPENNFYFFYNGDSNDEASSSSPGYGDNIPLQSISFFDRPMSHFISYNNSSNPISGQPTVPTHYSNYLNAKWKNGQDLYFGGNGWDPGTGADPENPVAHMYPSDPSLPAGDGVWNEGAAANPPGDRRGVGSFESIQLASEESVMFDLAFVSILPETPGGPTENNFAPLNASNALAGEFYQDQEFSQPQIFPVGLVEMTIENSLSIFPNPASEQITIWDEGNLISKASIFDLHGRLVKEFSTNSDRVDLDVSDMNSGLYIVSILNATGQIKTKKVIVE